MATAHSVEVRGYVEVEGSPSTHTAGFDLILKLRGSHASCILETSGNK